MKRRAIIIAVFAVLSLGAMAATGKLGGKKADGPKAVPVVRGTLVDKALAGARATRVTRGWQGADRGQAGGDGGPRPHRRLHPGGLDRDRRSRGAAHALPGWHGADAYGGDAGSDLPGNRGRDRRGSAQGG